MDGFLLVDKPAGISSFGVVAKVRWLIKEATGQKIKIGHTGTLDPAASGLMILVIGNYCKRAAEFSKLDKTYEVETTLGATSSTGDIEGEITPKSTHQPGLSEVNDVLNKFIGEIQQTPPIYSAIKVGGQRAYKLARAGKTPRLEPRQVTVYSLQLTDYSYPKLKFTVRVSSGTYIRSLAEDIGKQLGAGAYMSALKRTRVASYNLEDAVIFNRLTYDEVVANLKQAPS